MKIAFGAAACLALAGCQDAREIDSDSYVIAIGADTAENGYSFTFQFSNPLEIYSDGGEDGSTSTVTLSAESFKTAKGLLGSFIGKNINLSQTKVIVFSYDAAKSGTSALAKSLLTEREIRGDAFLLIASPSAAEFLGGVEPILSISAAKYYENLFRDDTLKFAPLTSLKTLGETLENDWFDCVIPLAGLAEESGGGEAGGIDFAAGERARSGGEKTEVIGMAVMKDGQMLEALSGYSAAIFKILDGTAENLPLPVGGSAFEITEKPRVSKSVLIQNGTPKIFVNARLTAECEDADAVAELLSNELSDFLYKTAREYGTDIFGFGSAYRLKCLTTSSFENTNWSEIYKRAEFDINVTIRRAAAKKLN